MMDYYGDMKIPTSSAVAFGLIVFSAIYFLANHGLTFPVLKLGGFLP